MTREERRSSITGPVAVGGAAITPRLVNRLLNDVGDNPDQLPILQHALMRTWDRWKQDAQGDDSIDLRHYEAIGGLSEALSLHADEAYDELSESRRALAERIFRWITEKGRDNREVRRPLTMRDICTVTLADEPEVIAVVEIFRRADRSFLMPSAEVVLSADSLIDISHESLIRNWKRLKAWVEDEAQSAAIYRRLAETAVLHGEGGAGLWRDPDLQIALDWRERVAPNAAWARRYHPGFAEANGFLEESLALREAEAREKEERRRRELTRARIVAAILGLAFLISAGLALMATKSGKKRWSKRTLPSIRKSWRRSGNDPIASSSIVAQMNLAQKAFSEGDSGRGNEHLNTALPTAAHAPRDDMRSFGWYLLWQLHHHEKATLAEHAGRVSSVAFAPDGKTLAWGGQEGTVKLWDVATRRALATLEGGAGNVASIAFAPDGKVLAVGSTDGTMKLWDVVTRWQVATLKGHSKWVTSVVFAPDGKTLASAGDDGTVKLWAVVTGQALATFKGHPEGVFSVAFTPDGKALTAGSADGAVQLWDVRTSQNLATFGGRAGGALAVAFTPDGKTLASESEDGTVKLWEKGNPQSPATSLEGHTGEVFAVVFPPDGKRLASGGGDGTVKLWETGELQAPATPLEGHTGNVFSVAFAPDGKMLASGSQDGAVKLWGADTRQTLATLEGKAGEVSAVAFSPDGEIWPPAVGAAR